jgi:hypothetical protein
MAGQLSYVLLGIVQQSESATFLQIGCKETLCDYE